MDKRELMEKILELYMEQKINFGFSLDGMMIAMIIIITYAADAACSTTYNI